MHLVRSYYTIILILLLTASFDLPAQEQIKGARIEQHFPNIDWVSIQLKGYDTSAVQVYYYKNITLYEYPVHVNLEGAESIVFYYFAHHKDSANGFLYSRIRESDSISVDKQSVAFFMDNHTWIYKNNAYRVFRDNDMLLLSVQKNKKEGERVETYRATPKNDTTQHGTCIYSYTSRRLQGIAYSLSKELDSIKMKRLYSIRYMQPSRYLSDQKVQAPAYEIRYRLIDIPIDAEKRKDLLMYFDLYSKQQ